MRITSSKFEKSFFSGIKCTIGCIIPEYFPSKKNTFILKVKGDSMTGEGIREGDLLLVRRQHTANNRDIVVALIDGEALVKKFYRDRNTVRLESRFSKATPTRIQRDSASSAQPRCSATLYATKAISVMHDSPPINNPRCSRALHSAYQSLSRGQIRPCRWG